MTDSLESERKMRDAVGKIVRVRTYDDSDYIGKCVDYSSHSGNEHGIPTITLKRPLKNGAPSGHELIEFLQTEITELEQLVD